MIEFCKKHTYPLLLTTLVMVIAWLNYTPGTWLTGWDTLHPEVDFALNFKRLIFGVWREGQGLGAVAGHSHMADLPRVFVLWLLHFIAPLSTLRYLWVFGSLLLGVLGMFWVIREITHNKTVAFLGALFYLFNLGTVQQFFVPFEMFTTQYAFLPWIVLFSIQYLANKSHSAHDAESIQIDSRFHGNDKKEALIDTGWDALPVRSFMQRREGETGPATSLKGWAPSQKRYLLLFSLVTLLATPQAYAAHLWYAFFGVWIIFLAVFGILHKNSLKKILVLIFLTLAINSFWLLPNLYFIKTQGAQVTLAKQNRLFSQEFRLRNREFGHLKDVSLLRGFYLGWDVYNFQRQTTEPLMPAWQGHLKNPATLFVGYSLFLLAILGLLGAAQRGLLRTESSGRRLPGGSFRKKNPIMIVLSPFFIVPFALLANRVPPFNLLFDGLSYLPLFSEALRFVFTKLSIMLTFAYSLYAAYFISLLFERANLFNRRLLTIVIALSLFWYAWPMFTGNLISTKMRVVIPKEYQELWDFMKTQPDGLVAPLPLQEFTGWQYYQWHYQGAGFVWFGLKQPILDRDFDRWSLHNEQAFRELQYGLYRSDPMLFNASLEKFGVRYLLWDKNIISLQAKNRNAPVYERETEKMIEELLQIGVIREIGPFFAKAMEGEKIRIFEILKPKPQEETLTGISSIAPAYIWNSVDYGYLQHGNYLSRPADNAIFYPFRTFLSTSDRVADGLLEIDSDDQTYNLIAPKSSTNGVLQIPDLVTGGESFFADVWIAKNPNGKLELTFFLLLPENLRYTAKAILPVGNSEAVTINDDRLSIKGLKFTTSPIFVGQARINPSTINYLNGLPADIEFQKPPDSNIGQIIGKFPLKSLSLSPREIFGLNADRQGIKLQQNETMPYIAIDKSTAATGVFVDLANLPHEMGYLLDITSRNRQGLPLRVCLKNLFTGTCDFYDELSAHSNFGRDIFVIPPSGPGFGYSLTLDNITHGHFATANDLAGIRLLPFPYTYLSQLQYGPQKTQTSDVFVSRTAFNEGWKAYSVISDQSSVISKIRTILPFFFGTPIREHVLVNNWANGWIVGDQHSGVSIQESALSELKTDSGKLITDNRQLKTDSGIVIIFWPQYLEFVGFGLLLVALIAVLKKK